MSNHKNQPSKEEAEAIAKQQSEAESRIAEAEAKQKAEEEEENLKALAAATANKVRKEAEPPTGEQPAPIAVGDIKVFCLVDDSSIKMGGRRYPLKKGKVVSMDPSHARHLQKATKVVIRG